MTNHQDKELSGDSKEAFQQWCNDHPEYRFWNSTDIAESAWIAGRKSALATSPQLPVAEQPAEQAVEVVACEIGDYLAVDAKPMATVIYDDMKIAECYTNEDAVFVADALRGYSLSPVAQMSGDMQKAITIVREYFDGTDDENDIDKLIGLLQAASHPSNAAGQNAQTGYSHQWDRDGERCVKCGDKDWMGGSCSVPDAAATVPQVVQAPTLQPIDTAPHGATVLLACEYENGKGYVCIGNYIAKFSDESNSDEDNCEYNEADDTYYIREGWYEHQYNWGEYRAIAISDKIVGWLPAPTFRSLTTASNAGEAAQGDK